MLRERQGFAFDSGLSGLGETNGISMMTRRSRGGFNWVKALTAGFEEPYAVSLFAGDVVGFDVPESKEIKGTATAGTFSAQATAISRTTR